MADHKKSENDPKTGNVKSNLKIEELEIEINFNYKFADDTVTQTPQRNILRVISTISNTLKCDFCPMTYNDKNDLQVHIEGTHQEVQKIIAEAVCVKTPLKIHNHNKRIERVFCDLCNKSIRRKHIKRHLIIHTSETEVKYCCTICGKKFREKYKLKQHQAFHTEKSKCNLCRNSALVQHLNIHTGSKSYKCPRCGKAFFTTNQLSIHKASTRPEALTLICKTCNKLFATKSGLEIHLKTHILIHKQSNPITCKICNKLFTGKSALNEHLKTEITKKQLIVYLKRHRNSCQY